MARAQSIVNGQQFAAANTGTSPKGADTAVLLDASLGDASPAERAAVKSAADGLYVHSRMGESMDEFDPYAYQAALDSVMDGVGVEVIAGGAGDDELADAGDNDTPPAEDKATSRTMDYRKGRDDKVPPRPIGTARPGDDSSDDFMAEDNTGDEDSGDGNEGDDPSEQAPSDPPPSEHPAGESGDTGSDGKPLKGNPKYRVPGYRKESVPKEDLDRFMGHHGDVGGKTKRSMAEIFAAEGGFKKDASGSSAYGGMTDGGLETAKKTQPDLADVGKAHDLSEKQLAKAYRGYMDDAMRKYGGADKLEGFKSPETAAAFADPLFKEGANGGARIIKDATNKAIDALTPQERQKLGVSRLDSRNGPKDTLAAAQRLANNGHGKQLRKQIVAVRIAEEKDPRVYERIRHFGFQDVND